MSLTNVLLMLSLFLSLGFPYRMIVPKWQNESRLLCLYFIKQQNILTVSSIFEQDVISDFKKST